VEFDVGLVTKSDAKSRKCRLDAVDQERRFDVADRNAGRFVSILPPFCNYELGPIVGRREQVAIVNAGWFADIGSSIRRLVGSCGPTQTLFEDAKLYLAQGSGTTGEARLDASPLWGGDRASRGADRAERGCVRR
jgi:hypothetical protein